MATAVLRGGLYDGKLVVVDDQDSITLEAVATKRRVTVKGEVVYRETGETDLKGRRIFDLFESR